MFELNLESGGLKDMIQCFGSGVKSLDHVVAVAVTKCILLTQDSSLQPYSVRQL